MLLSTLQQHGFGKLSKYYSQITHERINNPQVPDDGSEVAGNQTLWSLIKTKLFDIILADVQELDTAIEAGFSALEPGVQSIRTFTAPLFDTGFGTASGLTYNANTTMALIILVGRGGEHENAATEGGSALSTAGYSGGSGELKIQLITHNQLGAATFAYQQSALDPATQSPGYKYEDSLGNNIHCASGQVTRNTELAVPQSHTTIGTEQLTIPGGGGMAPRSTVPGVGAPGPLGSMRHNVDVGVSNFYYTYGSGRDGAPGSSSYPTDSVQGQSALIVAEFG